MSWLTKVLFMLLMFSSRQRYLLDHTFYHIYSDFLKSLNYFLIPCLWIHIISFLFRNYTCQVYVVLFCSDTLWFFSYSSLHLGSLSILALHLELRNVPQNSGFSLLGLWPVIVFTLRSSITFVMCLVKPSLSSIFCWTSFMVECWCCLRVHGDILLPSVSA